MLADGFACADLSELLNRCLSLAALESHHQLHYAAAASVSEVRPGVAVGKDVERRCSLDAERRRYEPGTRDGFRHPVMREHLGYREPRSFA